MHSPPAAKLLLLSALCLMTSCDHKGENNNATQNKNDATYKKALPLPTGTPKRPVGVAAITAKPGSATPFTKDEVVAYFKTHNLPRNMGSTDQFQVDSLDFITSAEVSRRLQGAATGLSDNDRIGFARLSGTFVFTGPREGKPVTFKQAYAAFDASTGNLLMAGTLQ
jgi:hypothetical protein